MTHSLWICVALLLHSCDAFDKLPNGNGCFSNSNGDGIPCTDTESLGGVVAEWIKGGTDRATIVLKYGEIEIWDTTNVLSMENLFYYKDSFNGDISKWDTSQVTDMTNMFASANAFNGDISNWDTSQVTDMSSMFYGATSFNNGGQPLNWDTSEVTDMRGMFASATAFNGDISKWNTAKVTDMSYMFQVATLFNGDISQWNTDEVTTMEEIFSNSGFSRTLCGGAWESLTGPKNAFNNLGSSTARYGCCPAGSFMSDPFVPFTEANSCTQCTAGKYGTNVLNDDTTCQDCQAGQYSTAGAPCQNCQSEMYSLPGEACKIYSVQWLKNAYDSIGGTC